MRRVRHLQTASTAATETERSPTSPKAPAYGGPDGPQACAREITITTDTSTCSSLTTDRTFYIEIAGRAALKTSLGALSWEPTRLAGDQVVLLSITTAMAGLICLWPT